MSRSKHHNNTLLNFFPMGHSTNLTQLSMHGVEFDPHLSFTENLFNGLNPYAFAPSSDQTWDNNVYPQLPPLGQLLDQHNMQESLSLPQLRPLGHLLDQHDSQFEELRSPFTPPNPSAPRDTTLDMSTISTLPNSLSQCGSTRDELTQTLPPIMPTISTPPNSLSQCDSTCDELTQTLLLTDASEHVLQQGTGETVPDANNSSWATINPNRPVLTPCVPLNAAQKACANTQRASRKILSQQRKEAEDGLHTAIQQLL
ncbi:uncharacterized protein EDB91DRAFT_1253876 [Suillus paluster]|uniref:uncharacterized protein n=1 Tax=Suillus paluster TaxID=48578 RepID=UPI001B86B398|nr:uncharacterized protein EDB91DRAFT_1253876 [Suillus paluster]KAG1727461.1 hypothetical protein EDB91DRAFT_1253876 [Suillus paluster]